MGHITDDRDVDADHLVDRRGVDVDMRLGGFWAETVNNTGDPVVEPRANVDHQITIMHRHIGLVKPVHPEHPKPFVTRRRVGAEAHQRGGDGKAGGIDQFAQQLARCRAGVDDPAAGVEDRPLRRLHGRHQFGDFGHVALDLRLIARGGGFGGLVMPGGELHVLRYVDQHRAGAAMGGDVEGLMQGGAKGVGLFHQPIVLGAGAGDAHGVGLLKGVGADHEGRHLTGQHHKRNGIEQRIRKARDRIRGTGAGGHQHHARFASGTGIAFGGVHRPLLMAHQNVFDRILLKDLVIDR